MNDIHAIVKKNGHHPPTSAAMHLSVLESMAFLYGAIAAWRLAAAGGRAFLTVMYLDGTYEYTETWYNGFRFDQGPVTRDEALALLGETR